MKSLYAVASQITMSASNYVVFVLLARILSPVDFIAFATAVGLNMFAYAVAEGGVSYVAPRELADRTDARVGAMAGAFVAISTVLYLISLAVGYFLWNALSKDQLNIQWVAAYALYFGPAILMPAWVTCWSMDRVSVLVLFIVRAAIVTAVYVLPGPQILAVSGIVSLLLVFCLLCWLNREQRVIGWADRKSFSVAVRRLREVFMAKSMSYTIYSLLPLVVGVLRGNAAASDYVIGERIKSLYATVFQPFIQTIYLWQYQSADYVHRKHHVIWVVNIVNLVICIGLLVLTQTGMLALLGERFSTVIEMPVYVLAAGLSVSTTSLLYFKVFTSGDYIVFRRASTVQFVTFTGLFVGLATFADLKPAWVLCIGEATLLIGLLSQLFFRSGRTNVQINKG
jgi:O-antigen/teichoic acid export membrane protein